MNLFDQRPDSYRNPPTSELGSYMDDPEADWPRDLFEDGDVDGEIAT